MSGQVGRPVVRESAGWEFDTRLFPTLPASGCGRDGLFVVLGEPAAVPTPEVFVPAASQRIARDAVAFVRESVTFAAPPPDTNPTGHYPPHPHPPAGHRPQADP